MVRYESPVRYEEILAEAHYNKVKADLARSALDYYIDHGMRATDSAYKAMYQKYVRCKKRRCKLLKLAEGWGKNGT